MRGNILKRALLLPRNIYSRKRTLFIRPSNHQRLQFVPECHNSERELDYITSQLDQFIAKHRKLFIITGAGISTESGIRDYRSEGVGLYATSTNRPMEYHIFLKSAEMRRRYWARNYVGWDEFGSRQPNEAHFALARLEKIGLVHWLVTQNVDALHTKAGSGRITELHGCSHRVICLGCKQITLRHMFQQQLAELNPDWHAIGQGQAPDGDAFLADDIIKSFRVPKCTTCGGILKPEVVFFGDSVPKPTVNFVYERLHESDALWIIGSTVEVYSSYRFVLEASQQKKPIAILNIGKTRADKLASFKVSGVCGRILPRLEVLQTVI